MFLINHPCYAKPHVGARGGVLAVEGRIDIQLHARLYQIGKSEVQVGRAAGSPSIVGDVVVTLEERACFVGDTEAETKRKEGRRLGRYAVPLCTDVVIDAEPIGCIVVEQ